jgi:hypothetical protein
MITDALLLRFKLNLEWSRAFQEALSAATTEEQKREICEQFKNDAEAKVAAARQLGMA